MHQAAAWPPGPTGTHMRSHPAGPWAGRVPKACTCSLPPLAFRLSTAPLCPTPVTSCTTQVCAPDSCARELGVVQGCRALVPGRCVTAKATDHSLCTLAVLHCLAATQPCPRPAPAVLLFPCAPGWSACSSTTNRNHTQPLLCCSAVLLCCCDPGWNACSSCYGEAGKSRKYLVLPALKSGRVYGGCAAQSPSAWPALIMPVQWCCPRSRAAPCMVGVGWRRGAPVPALLQ